MQTNQFCMCVQAQVISVDGKKMQRGDLTSEAEAQELSSRIAASTLEVCHAV